MSVYIYERMGGLTTAWHNGGGLVIVTDRNPQDVWADYLHAIATEHPSNVVYLDPETITQMLPDPDSIVATSPGQGEHLFVFPDAGCC